MLNKLPLAFSLPLALLVVGLFVVITAPAKAVEIDITQGNVDPVTIAIAPFGYQSPEEQPFASDIAAVIGQDLTRSGLFTLLPKEAYIEQLTSLNKAPKFADWRVINAQILIQGRVLMRGGRVQVDFRLWDTFTGKHMVGKSYTGPANGWRRISHKIADTVYERITGEKGYFNTRIVYVAETGAANDRMKRLAIMDQDGANHHYLTSGGVLVLTPRFSPSYHKVAYMSYYKDVPRVYVYDLEQGTREALGDFPGMTFAPRFTPDGDSVLMSLALNGNSEIYRMNINSKEIQRLTNHPAIDTSPSPSPDGKQVTFNSDRSGSPQLYVMDANGKNSRRISFGKGRYLTPVWSPRGDLIAFTKILGGEFYIGVMAPDGSGERSLAKAFLVEGPTWSPNGRVLAYFRQDKGDDRKKGHHWPRLETVDLTGYNRRTIATPVGASDPAWSPSLP